MIRSQRAYVAIAASPGGVDGASVPRTRREKYIALHHVYCMASFRFGSGAGNSSGGRQCRAGASANAAAAATATATPSAKISVGARATGRSRGARLAGRSAYRTAQLAQSPLRC